MAYTDPDSRIAFDEAAFLSKMDLLCSHGLTGAEFKKKNPGNKEWFKINSALAQLLCALAGHPTTGVAVFLYDDGFLALWREPAAQSIDGLPTFDYFCFPPRTGGRWFIHF